MNKNELHIYLLGTPEVLLEGETVTGFISDKTRGLLYYLAATGELHTRQSLASLFWGDMPEAQALKNLRQALYNLQQMLAPHLDVTRQTVRLLTGDVCQVDVAALVAALADPAPDALEEAAQLYRGDFLTGFSVADAPEFEQWQTRQGEHLRRQLVDALRTASADLDKATRLTYLRHLVRLEPWAEESQRQLMEVLARQGEYAQALIQYERLAAALNTELGIAPQPHSQRLRERIQRARQRPRTPLPPLPFALLGREEEAQRLSDWLAADSSHAPRLITLLGPGGIGKTHLALATAHSQRHAFLDGVWWVALLATSTAEEVALALARVLGLPITGQATPRQQLLRHIAGWNALLVLDNSEHLVNDDFADLIVAILESAPEVRILLTSRKRLNLRREQLLPLEGLADTGAVERLFVARAQQMQPDFVPTAEDSAAIRRIGALLDGTPLGLELAAGLTDRYDCATVAHNLAANWDSLASSLRDVPPRQRSLRAVFDYSWHLLEETEQRLLSLLTVFVDGFSQEAAEALVDGLGIVPSAALHSLVSHSLLRFDPQQARYAMHDLVRQFARERLEADPQRQRQAEETHSLYFAQFLHSRDEMIQQGHPPTMAAVNGEMGNIQAMWRRVCDSRQVLLVAQALQPLGFFCDGVARYVEGKGLYAYALARLDTGAESGPLPLQKTVCSLLGAYANMLDRLGEYSEALTVCGRAVEIARRIGYAQAVGVGLLFLGRIESDRGGFAQSEAYLRQAVDFCVENGLSDTQARASFRLGEALFHQGHLDEAWACYEMAQRLFQTEQDRRGLFFVALAMGEWKLEQGEVAAAQDAYTRGLTIARSSGQAHLQAAVHRGLAHSLARSGRPAEAESLLLAGLALLADMPPGLPFFGLVLPLAVLYSRAGQAEKAESLLHWVGAKASAIDTPRHQIPVLLAFAQLFGQTQLEKAAALVRLIVDEPASTWAQRRQARAGLTGKTGVGPGLWASPSQALADLIDENIARRGESLVQALCSQEAYSCPAGVTDLYQSIGLL